MATRWGICGAGKISGDFTNSLTSQSTTEHQVVAVAARKLERAQEFASERSIPQAYGSYQELADDPNVDVVYIGTIHPEHHKLTLLFLNHGKHVLVEKPAAMNLKQLKEMTSLARERNLFFMEAVWSRFFPLYESLIKELASGAIGNPKLLRIEFAIPIWEVPRVRQKDLGGGALLDIGVYPLNIAVFLFGRPDKILTEGSLMDTGVDEAVCVIFKYNDGRMAQLNCSVAYKGLNEVTIFGTKGNIKVHNPMWCPTEMTLPSGKMTFELPKTSAKFNFDNSVGMAYEAVHVRKCLKEGKLESPDLPMDHSEFVMGLVDQIKKGIGLRYEVDD